MQDSIENSNVLEAQPLIAPRQLKEKLPISDKATAVVLNTRKAIRDIIHGRDKKRLVMVVVDARFRIVRTGSRGVGQVADLYPLGECRSVPPRGSEPSRDGPAMALRIVGTLGNRCKVNILDLK